MERLSSSVHRVRLSISNETAMVTIRQMESVMHTRQACAKKAKVSDVNVLVINMPYTTSPLKLVSSIATTCSPYKLS